MWKMGCRSGEVLWTLPSVRAPVLSSRQTASVASLSSIDQTQILTSHPKRCPETPRRPVSCELSFHTKAKKKYNCYSNSVIALAWLICIYNDSFDYNDLFLNYLSTSWQLAPENLNENRCVIFKCSNLHEEWKHALSGVPVCDKL